MARLSIRDIVFREITSRAPEDLRPWTDMLRKSWGSDFPVDPFEEVSKAACIIGVFHRDVLVGAACMNLGSNVSPDGKDLDQWWLSGLVVTDTDDGAYRQIGIASRLHGEFMDWARRKGYKGDLVASTENVPLFPFFYERGWHGDRLTIIEDGSPSMVFKRSVS